MAKIKKPESEVQPLNCEELDKFRDWFKQYDSDEWDSEIEEPALKGKSDKMAQKTIAAHKIGRAKEI